MKEVFGAEKLETAKDVKVFLCDKKHQEKFLDVSTLLVMKIMMWAH